jgi:hypothetical protein
MSRRTEKRREFQSRGLPAFFSELEAKYEKLLEDHIALCDAVHDQRGRIGMLEARVAYLESERSLEHASSDSNG